MRKFVVIAIVVAVLGALVAIIGADLRTGEQRFTFGVLDLWEGIKLPALVTGLFVIPEMLAMKRHDDDAAQEPQTHVIASRLITRGSGEIRPA